MQFKYVCTKIWFENFRWRISSAKDSSRPGRPTEIDKLREIVIDTDKMSTKNPKMTWTMKKEKWTIHNWLKKPPFVHYLRLTYGTKYDMT